MLLCCHRCYKVSICFKDACVSIFGMIFRAPLSNKSITLCHRRHHTNITEKSSLLPFPALQWQDRTNSLEMITRVRNNLPNYTILHQGLIDYLMEL